MKTSHIIFYSVGALGLVWAFKGQAAPLPSTTATPTPGTGTTPSGGTGSTGSTAGGVASSLLDTGLSWLNNLSKSKADRESAQLNLQTQKDTNAAASLALTQKKKDDAAAAAQKKKDDAAALASSKAALAKAKVDAQTAAVAAKSQPQPPPVWKYQPGQIHTIFGGGTPSALMVSNRLPVHQMPETNTGSDPNPPQRSHD